MKTTEYIALIFGSSYLRDMADTCMLLGYCLCSFWFLLTSEIEERTDVVSGYKPIPVSFAYRHPEYD